MTTMNDAPLGFMPIPTAEQLAEALANVRSFHDMSAELIAPELLKNLLAAIAANPTQKGEAVEVVAWGWECLGQHVTADKVQAAVLQSYGAGLEPLMTVAQHQRILAASVPSGCKVVPVEATEDMKEAGCQAYMNADAAAWIMHRSSMGAAYKAMVSSTEGVKDERG